MVLGYSFELMVPVLCSASEHINRGWYEPHYRRSLEEVDYDYKVNPTEEDVIEFLLDQCSVAKLVKEGIPKDHVTKLLEALLDDYDFIIEAFEDNEDFYDFMKDKYSDEAYEAAKEYYSE